LSLSLIIYAMLSDVNTHYLYRQWNKFQTDWLIEHYCSEIMLMLILISFVRVCLNFMFISMVSQLVSLIVCVTVMWPAWWIYCPSGDLLNKYTCVCVCVCVSVSVNARRW